MITNETDYRDVFAKKADYTKAHKSHRTRTLLGREEQNFASGYADYLRGQYAAGGAPLDTSHFITVPDAAARLGLSRQRVHVLIRRGRLDAVQVGEGTRRVWLVNGEKLHERITGRRPKEEQP